MYKLQKIKPTSKFRIWLQYTDGTEGIVDLSHLAGIGIFKAWENEIKFEDAYIDEESGALSWSKEIDLCPDSLYFKLKKIDPENYLAKEASLDAFN